MYGALPYMNNVQQQCILVVITTSLVQKWCLWSRYTKVLSNPFKRISVSHVTEDLVGLLQWCEQSCAMMFSATANAIQ